MRQRRRFTLCMCSGVLLTGMLGSVPLGAQEKAILPVDAPPALAQELNQKLQDQVARQGVEGVLGPIGVRARLTGRLAQDPLLEQAKAQISSAGEHALYMKREQAVGAAREAISSLQRIHGALLFPGLMAQAQEALALALLLQPEDEAGAEAAFRAAIDADPAYQPNPNRMTSKVLRLVKQARRRWHSPRSLTSEEVSALAHRLTMTRLVWLAVRREPQGLTLSAALYDQRGTPMASRQIAGVLPPEMLTKAASLVVQLLDPPQAPASIAVGKERSGDQASLLFPRSLPPRRAESSRWYQKWWVWTAVGIVLAGTGVGIALAVQGETPSGTPGAMDIEFTF